MVIYVAILGNFQLVAATDTADRVSPKVAIVSPVATDLQLDFSLLTFGISLFPFLFFKHCVQHIFLEWLESAIKMVQGVVQSFGQDLGGVGPRKLFTKR